jgi:hypothetical protein
VQPIIVEASEAWPVVVAGLGSAFIVALITLWVARTQRKADKEGLDRQLKEASYRLDRQLAWDRKLREREMSADAERLDKQLAQDRELREQQVKADRDARDLQFLRETLAPIVARALDWDKFTSLHKGLSTVGDEPADPESAWVTVIIPLVSQVAAVAEQLRRDARALVIVDGLYSRVAATLKAVADDGDTLIGLAKERAEAGWTTPAIQAALGDLFTKYGNDHSRFIEAANEAVRGARLRNHPRHAEAERGPSAAGA